MGLKKKLLLTFVGYFLDISLKSLENFLDILCILLGHFLIFFDINETFLRPFWNISMTFLVPFSKTYLGHIWYISGTDMKMFLTLFNGTGSVSVGSDRLVTIHQLGQYRTECITGTARERHTIWKLYSVAPLETYQ